LQQQSKGYEIRLKSTFSRAKADGENITPKENNAAAKAAASSSSRPRNALVAAFGRTHPNHKSKTKAAAAASASPVTSTPNNTQQPQWQQQPPPPSPPQEQEYDVHYNNNNNEPMHHGSSRALPEGLPFHEVNVAADLERSVSELTMRSHGAFDRHRHAPDSRRMAYYAVGRNHQGNDNDNNAADDNNNHNNNHNSNNGGRGGNNNRRCYFTGNAIRYGMPFYAGSVQQGPRTLVVFCLPSALDLPHRPDDVRIERTNANAHLVYSGIGNGGNGAVPRERYLESLPDPDARLLEEMARRYPAPFRTLPVQVRSSHCWRLFVKFCFFSGLPIAEGEMHYRVKGSVMVFPTNNGAGAAAGGNDGEGAKEEIALSHEVMEAVNGEVSAEMLRLPNQTLFDYLKRQYSQQSSKLSDRVFVRSSWEMVRPEV